MLVAPTEPTQLKNLGKVSGQPEQYGVDFMWWCAAEKRFAGVQRKEVKDFYASVRDGRLVKEIGQWGPLAQVLVVVEGMVEVRGGEVRITDYAKMSVAEWQGCLWRIADAGAKVTGTVNVGDTAEMIQLFHIWSRKHTHTSLTARPTATRGSSWGRPTDREFGLHLLQGFPGVGRGLAERIYDHFGRVPLAWDVTAEELMGVAGVGQRKAQRMLDAVGGGNVVEAVG